MNDLDLAITSHLLSYFPKYADAVFAQVNKHFNDVICILRARELGYKGADPVGAKKRIENLCQRILIFQEQDKNTGFGHGVHLLHHSKYNQTEMRDQNQLPLVPQFPSKAHPKNTKPLFPHPLKLLFEVCKNWNLEKICKWFLLNPGYYMSEETPWIDFFEVESSWTQVPQRSIMSNGETMLYHVLALAYYFQRTKLIQILVNKGSQLDQLAYMRAFRHPFNPFEYLPTPLRSAIAHGNQEQIDFLLSKGVKIKSADLTFALNIEEGTVNIPILKYILPLCKKPFYAFDPLGRNDFWDKAVLLESQEAIELFLQQGCVIDPQQALDLMFFFMRRRISHEKGYDDPFAQFYLNVLFEKNMDINGFHKEGSLLKEAVRKQSLEWTRWLLEKGAEVDKPQDDLPLSELCRTATPSPKALDLIRLLLSFGANPLLGGFTNPYRCAQNFNAHEIVALFDEHIRLHGIDGNQG